jgi:enoyl-CoA hydratase/carnithine racemase
MTSIELRREGRVAHLRLNGPEKLNALTPQLLRELIDCCGDLADDDSVDVVVLEGEGDAFCAGADLAEFSKELAAAPGETADLGRVATNALADLPQITVAIIQGHCVGGGPVLAAACDLRVAADNARFWIPELGLGIPLTWGGWEHLIRLIGETAAIDVVLTARPFGADEAMNLGFVSRVIPVGELETESTDLIRTIAANGPAPLRITKRQLKAIRAGTFDARNDAPALLRVLADPDAGQVLGSQEDPGN